MAFCPECGAPLAEDARFCRTCGAPHAGTEHPARPPAPPQDPKSSGAESRWWIVGLAAVLVAGGLAAAAIVTGWPGNPGVPLSAPPTPSPALERATPTPTGAPSATASPQAFSDLFEQQRDGVVRVEVVTCDGGGVGTGFVVGEGTVVTAAHVVDQAVTVGLSVGDTTTTGGVIGVDHSTDLAAIRPEEDLGRYHFEFDDDGVQVGAPVMAVGFPRGEPLSLSQGAVSGLDRDVAGLSDLIQTDTALNPGNSGGPLIDRQGQVVGVVTLKDPQAEGIGYAIPARTAAGAVDTWQASPQNIPTPSCEQPLGPSGEVPVQTDQDLEEIADVFAAYFSGINHGDYRTAWRQLSPQLQDRQPFPEFRTGVETSYDFDIRVQDATFLTASTVQLWITFTSLQAPGRGPNGEACTNWSLDYTVRRINNQWRIDRATAHIGSSPSQPC